MRESHSRADTRQELSRVKGWRQKKKEMRQEQVGVNYFN